MMQKIRAYISPSQVDVSRITQVTIPVIRANVEGLVLGNGLKFWELEGRPDIYFSILDNFLNPLVKRGVVFWREARLLEVISKEKFLSA